MRQPPSTEASDNTLAEALRHGDRGAFTIVMTRHGKAVFRYAWRLADEADHVDDIAQETFLVLWKRRRQVTVAGDSLLPWLLATCRFVSFNANRKSRSRRTEQLPDAESAQPPVTGREELVWITEEIARLGPIDQRLCQLCLIDGHSYADATVLLGLTRRLLANACNEHGPDSLLFATRSKRIDEGEMQTELPTDSIIDARISELSRRLDRRLVRRQRGFGLDCVHSKDIPAVILDNTDAASILADWSLQASQWSVIRSRVVDSQLDAAGHAAGDCQTIVGKQVGQPIYPTQ